MHNSHQHGQQQSHQHEAVGADASTAIDPVCGMTLKITPATPHGEHGGKHYYFCSTRCRDKFRADPARAQPTAVPGVK